MITNRNDISQSDRITTLTADILAWIAADATRLDRFLTLSGLTTANLRAAAREPGFPLGVLNFLMSHEPTFLDYCNQRDMDPQDLSDLWQRLDAAGSAEVSP